MLGGHCRCRLCPLPIPPLRPCPSCTWGEIGFERDRLCPLFGAPGATAIDDRRSAAGEGVRGGRSKVAVKRPGAEGWTGTSPGAANGSAFSGESSI